MPFGLWRQPEHQQTRQQAPDGREDHHQGRPKGPQTNAQFRRLAPWPPEVESREPRQGHLPKGLKHELQRNGPHTAHEPDQPSQQEPLSGRSEVEPLGHPLNAPHAGMHRHLPSAATNSEPPGRRSPPPEPRQTSGLPQSGPIPQPADRPRPTPEARRPCRGSPFPGTRAAPPGCPSWAIGLWSLRGESSLGNLEGTCHREALAMAPTR